MAKTKKKLTKEEKLAKDRLRKRQKYAEIKNNPELYKIQQEKDRKTYLMKKERKKICSIKDMSARAQRDQRKRWRKNTQTYIKKKQKQKELTNILIENSPPESVNDIENDIPQNPNHIVIEPNPLPFTVQTEQTSQSNLKIRNNSEMTPTYHRRYRYKTKKIINGLQNEINKLKREKEMLRKKVMRQQTKLQRKPLEDTIEKNVKAVIEDINSGKVDQVKKKLLFDETLTRELKIKYKGMNKSEKRSFTEDIIMPNKAKFSKYKIISKVPFNVRRKLAEVQKNQIERKKRLIEDFFEDDVNSRMAAGKNEFVKKGAVKKQKRYLNDNLKNMHKKYCTKYGNISYTTFCRYRPYWVVFPKEERDTCQCKLHANVDLLIKALQKAKIISERSSTHVLTSLCCDQYDGSCLARSCDICKIKTLTYMEFDDTKAIDYFEWIVEKQSYRGKNGEQRVKTVTTKKKNGDKPRNIINKLDSIMKIFFKHVRNIVVQHSAITVLKQNIEETEVLIHVDFSENYCLKFHEEVQSFHFGSSRGQVSLHTVVLYYKLAEKGLCTKAICTMSQCLTHDASAIWAHITPLLNIAKQLVPSLSKVHFLSDSPSSQYRNRFIFYMITKIHEQVQTIKTETWNYQEAGHGKGAPDGVGAVLKRTADNHVKFGGDVGSFNDFVDLMREKVQNVEIIVISEEDITRNKFPAHVPGFKGTTKVHQALWSFELPNSVILRCLSCFSCLNSYIICEHKKHLGVLDIGFWQTTDSSNLDIDLNEHDSSTSQFDSAIKCNSQINLEVDLGVDCLEDTMINKFNNQDDENLTPLEIDSDTIYNNIEDNMLLSEFDGTLFLSGTIPSPVPATKTERERPKILSNIIFDYKSYLTKAHGSSQATQHSRKSDTQEDLQSVRSTEVQRNGIDRADPELQEIQECQSKLVVDTYDSSDIENMNMNAVDSLDLKYNLDDWVLVKYNSDKIRSHFVYYVGKIMETVYCSREYKVGFLKRSFGKTMKFVWPSITDEDIVHESQIVLRLSDPKESRRGQYSFNDLPNFNYE